MLLSEGLEIIERSLKKGKFHCLIDYLSNECSITLEKYNGDIEYEIKLDYIGEKKDLNEAFSFLREQLSKQAFFIDSIGRYSDYDVEYFSNGEEELSLFVYENEPLLKLKKHKNIDYNGQKIFCNEENFEYDSSNIKKILFSDNVQHLASMNKKRVKDFLICKKNLIIYASAFTLCEINGKVQLQYELEYYRHIPVENVQVDEELILNQLSQICNLISKDSNNTFVPGSELKCAFAKRYYSANKTKQDAVNCFFE